MLETRNMTTVVSQTIIHICRIWASS